MTKQVQKALKAVQREIEINTKTLKLEEYEEFLEELGADVESRLEAAREDKKRAEE